MAFIFFCENKKKNVKNTRGLVRIIKFYIVPVLVWKISYSGRFRNKNQCKKCVTKKNCKVKKKKMRSKKKFVRKNPFSVPETICNAYLYPPFILMYLPLLFSLRFTPKETRIGTKIFVKHSKLLD